DLKIFMDVDEDKKHQRILARSGEYMLERFKNEWIPLEQKYFDTFRIKENSHIVIDTTDLF
ncbi:MAG: uridine kinase, partial [Oscillospiraceae bacterium]|nr:uridine kinase [Oscillospiraceae bacterium]